MKSLVFLLVSTTLFALSNKVQVTSQSGGDQTDRVITIPRYFAEGEICSYPQPYVLGGAAYQYWQADIKNRWPVSATCAAGSVKFALITVQIPTLTVAGVDIEFKNSTNRSSSGNDAATTAAGLNKAGMLAFNGGVWPSRGSYTVGGFAFVTSAKTMLTNDHYRVLEIGPLRTAILGREDPESISGVSTRTTSFGAELTSATDAPYTAATWANTASYYSIRPSYVVAFYKTGAGAAQNVETDFILDNGWMDRAQDQRVTSMILYRDDTGVSAGYTAPGPFVFIWRARILETVWLTDPAASHIDFNFNYLYYSKVILPYSPDFTVSAAAETNELTENANPTGGGFDIGDQGVTVKVGSEHLGKGQWAAYDMMGATGGSRPEIAPFPRWDVRWIYRQSVDMLRVVLGNAKAAMHSPLFYIETKSTTYQSGYTQVGFGRFPNLNTRPTFRSSDSIASAPADQHTTPGGTSFSSGSSCGPPTCAVMSNRTGVHYPYSKYIAGGNFNGWGQEMAHQSNPYLAVYLATGKFVYTEAIYSKAMYSLFYHTPVIPVSYTDTSAEYSRWTGAAAGTMYSLPNHIRQTTWPLRSLAIAATFAPDNTPEKAYYTAMLNKNLELMRGRLNTPSLVLTAEQQNCIAFDKNTEASSWRIGRCFYENNSANPLGFFIRKTSASGLSSSVLYSCMTSTSNGACNQANYQQPYIIAVLSMLKGWGWDTDGVLNVVTKHMVGWAADSAMKSPLATCDYWTPIMKGDMVTYIDNWTDVYNGKGRTARLAKPVAPGDTSMVFVGSFGTASGGSPYVNQMDLDMRSNQWFKIGTELFKVNTVTTNSATLTVTGIDTALDRVSITSHGLNNADVISFRTGTMDAGMIAADGGSRCLTDRTGAKVDNCWFYAKAIDANTLELYLDSGLTQKVDLTGGSASVVAYQSTAAISATCGTGSQACRGQFGTAAGTHAAGATAEIQWMLMSPSKVPFDDADFSHATTFWSALSLAVDQGVSVIDSLTGETISAQRAYDKFTQVMRYMENIGDPSVNCAGKRSKVCGNPAWGWKPRHLVKDLIVTPTATSLVFNYTAPTADACKIGVSTTAFTSTNDSGDTSDSKVNPARQTSMGGLAGGTLHYYRITCGPNGTARVSGTATTL